MSKNDLITSQSLAMSSLSDTQGNPTQPLNTVACELLEVTWALFLSQFMFLSRLLLLHFQIKPNRVSA